MATAHTPLPVVQQESEMHTDTPTHAITPSQAPRIWTAFRITTLAAVIAVPVAVIAVRPPSGIVLIAIAAQIIVSGFSVKAWLLS
jgi:hypothetical protein